MIIYDQFPAYLMTSFTGSNTILDIHLWACWERALSGIFKFFFVFCRQQKFVKPQTVNKLCKCHRALALMRQSWFWILHTLWLPDYDVRQANTAYEQPFPHIGVLFQAHSFWRSNCFAQSEMLRAWPPHFWRLRSQSMRNESISRLSQSREGFISAYDADRPSRRKRVCGQHLSLRSNEL